MTPLRASTSGSASPASGRPASPGLLTDEIENRSVGGDDWRLWRAIRIRALREAPAAFGSTYERELAFEGNDWRGRLDPGGAAVLALAGDGPVGKGGAFADIEGWLRIVAMWVDPAWRGHGIGTRILDHLVEWARERGLRVHLDVTFGNDSARGVHKRCGFAETGEFDPLRPGSSYILERMVLPD